MPDTTSLEQSQETDYRPGTLPEVFRLTERLARRLRAIQRRTVDAVGLTPPQYVVLDALWERDGRPLKDLAAIAHCTRPTVTGLVDALERKRLVTRRPNPDDRRSLLVTLTEEGRALRGSAPTVADIYRGCCSGLNPAETRRLAALMKKLDSSLATWEVAR